MSFLKKIKYAISKGMEGTSIMRKLKEGLDMAGPAFGVGSNVSLNVKFNNMEEVRAHPMASQALVTLDQILQGVFDMDSKAILEFNTDFSKIDSDEIKKFIQENNYCKNKKLVLDVTELVLNMLDDFAPVTKLNFQGLLADYGSVDFRLQGTGYANLVSLLIRALSYRDRKTYPDRILEEFNGDSGAEKKDEEEYEKVEAKDA